MPVKLKPQAEIRGYKVEERLGVGAYALSYLARKDGRKYFLKQYKSPAPKAEWFDSYVRYAGEIKKRIQGDPAARTRCYEMVEFFVEKDFFQVFEFIEGGMSLTDVLEKRDTFDWPHLVTFAKVMMSGVDALHKVGVVHTDLKPDNIYLLPDPAIKVGYKLRIIDLDFSILTEKPAPWLGHMGFVGTPGYESPEHLRGEAPAPASDVFTCGVLLSQLLAGLHPYGSGVADIKEAVLSGQAAPFRLREPVKNVEDGAFLEGVITSTLAAEASRRPTAHQVAQALLGRTFDFAPWLPSASSSSSSRPVPAPSPNTPAAPAPASAAHSPASGAVAGTKRLSIQFEGREVLTVGAESRLGKPHFERLHEDARYLGKPQFRLFREGGIWMIEHDPGAANATMVNGERLIGAVPVTPGLAVCVGNPDKGISKFPLTLQMLP